MKKQTILFVLLLSLMTAGVFSLQNTISYASESSGRKIVTIVFDDSFSMANENRYSNANYAIQAFIALLNEEDELHLIYMSDAARQLAAQPGNFDPSAIAKDIDLTNPQSGADQVRNNPWQGAGTPFGAVQMGYNELVSHEDTDSSTQYYLIVLSDGGFMDDATNQITIDTGTVQGQFESFYGTLMPNQTHMNTYYLAIGAEAVALTDRPDLNFHAQTASDGQSMIHAIGALADTISGRYRLDASEISVYDTLVSFTSELPLKSLSFLSQGREAAVSSVIGPNGENYEIRRNVTLAPDGYNADPSLFGNAIVTDAGGANMPAGTYQVQFTAGVDPGSLNIMVEPAVECRLVVEYNGETVSAEKLAEIPEGETVTITAQAVESGTDTAVDSSFLEEGTANTLVYEVDGNEAARSDTGKLTITLQLGEGRISGQIQMPGFLPKTADERFTTKSKVVYRVESDAADVSVRQNELDSCEEIRFYLTADGVKMSADEAKNYPLSTPVLTGAEVEYEWYQDEDSGEWIFKPKGETDSTGTLTVYVENEELEASGQAVIDVIPRIHYQIIQIGGQDAHAAQTSLGQMEPIKFKITADAEALDRAAIDALKTKPALAVKMTDSSFFIWKTGEKRNGISGRWYIEDDGTCVYQPKGLSWFYGTGEVALTLSEEGSCTAVFTIEERSFLYWIPIGFVLFSLFLFWCIIGWIRQPKFNNQIMEIVVYTKFGSAIQESPRIKVMKRRIGLIPYRACRMRVGDLVFIAAPGRKIVLDKDCVRGRVVYSGKVRFMGRSAGNMKRLIRMMEPAKRDVRMVRGMELYVAPDKNAQALTGYRITG